MRMTAEERWINDLEQEEALRRDRCEEEAQEPIAFIVPAQPGETATEFMVIKDGELRRREHRLLAWGITTSGRPVAIGVKGRIPGTPEPRRTHWFYSQPDGHVVELPHCFAHADMVAAQAMMAGVSKGTGDMRDYLDIEDCRLAVAERGEGPRWATSDDPSRE